MNYLYYFLLLILTVSIPDMSAATSFPYSDNGDNLTHWQHSGTWGTTTQGCYSNYTCFTDSPDGATGNNADMALTLISPINLSSTVNPVLTFWHWYELEIDFDFAYVEISTDAQNWTQIYTANGISRQWQNVKIPLSSFKKPEVLIRFRVVSDKTFSGDGWWIDNIRIAEKPTPIMFLKGAVSTSDATAIDLTWTKNLDDNFLHYDIFRSIDDSFSSQVIAKRISDYNITTFTDTNLSPGTVYYYKIGVENTFNAQSSSKSISVSTGPGYFKYPFFDDASHINSKWSITGQWGLELLPAADSPYGITTSVWTDSPYEDYPESPDTRLQLTIDLRDALMPVLSFQQKYTFNSTSYADYGYVQVRVTGTSTWQNVYFSTGIQTAWARESIDLSNFVGNIVDIAFRVIWNNSQVHSLGWFLDDIRIDETPTPAITYPFMDDIESSASNDNWHTSSWQKVPVDNDSHFAFAYRSGGNVSGYIRATSELVLSGVMDLVNAEHPVLLLRHRYDFDDSGRIYISTSYGHPGTWEEVRSISYRQAEWWQQSVDFNKWAGLSNIRIKFVVSDYLHEQNDWTIDSITISEYPQAIELYPPTNIQEHTITLNWSQSTDDDFARYSIFRSETNNSNYLMLTEITTQHSNFYTDTKVPKPNTRYYYKIFVENIHGIKNTSNEIYVTSTSGITNNAYPLTDTMEQGDHFGNDLPWQLTDEIAHSGNYSWSDSPDGDYENDLDISLYTKINLKDATRPILSFWQRYNMEENADFGYVEISNYNASSFSRYYYVTGFSGESWEPVEMDISNYVNELIFIRFRFKSNDSVTFDGWNIDDLRIIDNTASAPFPFTDNFENMETIPTNWIVSNWELVNDDQYTGQSCISHKPMPSDASYVNSDLGLRGSLDFTNAINPCVAFWSRSHTNKVSLLISINGGKNWQEVWYNRSQSDWQFIQVDLSSFMGNSDIALKFKNHGSSAYDVWYIDDLRIDDAPQAITLYDPSNITEQSITLSWNQNTDDDFSHYEIYRHTAANVTRSHQLLTTITSANVCAYTDTDILNPNSTYYYKIYVVDQTGLINQSTNVIVATTTWGQKQHTAPFIDDMESGDNFGNEQPWAITDEDAHSGTFSWSDSPDGSYENNMNRSLYLDVDLSKTHRPVMTFWHRYNLQDHADWGYVYISNDNGSHWNKRYYVTGYSGLNWERVEMNLSDYAYQKIIIRFQISTDSSLVEDGWHIDDIQIIDNPAVTVYPFFDDLESENTQENWILSTAQKISSDSFSGHHCLTDSPNGNGAHSVYVDLVLRGSMDFKHAVRPQLSFWYHCSIGYNFYVYGSKNGGRLWTELWNMHYSKNDWTQAKIDLKPYKGLQNIAFKFMIRTYSSYDGYYLDDIRIGEDPDVPSTIQIVSGNNQTGVADMPLAQPFIARLFNPEFIPVVDVPVTFQIITENGGLLSVTRTTSDNTGYVSTLFTCGSTSGNNTVSATIDETTESVTFSTTTLMPGVALHLNRISGNYQVGLVDTSLNNPMIIQVTDVKNAPVSDVPISFYILSGSGTLNITETLTDDAGLASTHLTLDKHPEKVTVMATAPVLKGSLVSFTLFATLEGGTIGDIDGDHMPDDWENMHGFDPRTKADASLDNDNDGLSNVHEYANATDPNNSDTDADNMPDLWEVTYGLNPTYPYDAMNDNDHDGITNVEEYFAGSIPVKEPHFQLTAITDNWMDIYGTASIDNVPVAIGDEIAVLDPGGTVCGLFIVKTPGEFGFLHVFKDDPSTPDIDEGADQDDVLHFRIFDSSEGIEITTGIEVLSGTDPLTWTFDGDSAQINLMGGSIFAIPLHNGWNLISFPVKTCYYVDNISGYDDGPPNVPMLPFTSFKKVDSIADILKSIDGNYTSVRSSDKMGAHTFDPMLPEFSDIKYMAGGYGYWIEMTEPGILEIQGIKASPNDCLALEKGWNLVGYWGENVQHIQSKPMVAFPDLSGFSPVERIGTILQSIDGQYDVIRTFDSNGAHTYDPMLEPYSDVYYLGPGYGFWVRMNTSGEMSW
ncbi:MAG: hypothetical protein OMM_01006 [Candidatus Magnetoglobus multicellularis str. Araruama]|uniref:Fibronectin type-III domain-containing protein n=1 Tax=Candidatus Magnetoglobus multicellularis str. Araruama TaxID=890399 RepID=A0A1V1PEN6_9BACT|nr:MAG: hypothetical protein OMM_01006 [Candidatus Magnetoglobus multicellularis str. Araruama]